jgi:hypothetical protein
MSRFIHRPEGFSGKGDWELRSTARKVREAILNAQKNYQRESLIFEKQWPTVLAELLTEFAEDLHNDIGIWKVYEEHNQGLFGEPLPLTRQADGAALPQGLCKARVHHFLWGIYTGIVPELALSPSHPDLLALVEAVLPPLEHGFSRTSKDSGVKQFFGEPVSEAWQVKKTLLWLGKGSYFFRMFCDVYLAENVPDKDDPQFDANLIKATDTFLRKGRTAWSGLGCIEVLSGIMDLSESERADLLAWGDVDSHYFYIHTIGQRHVDAKELFSEKEYRIEIDFPKNPFKTKTLARGVIYAWKGDWRWSGNQDIYSNIDEDKLKEIHDSILEKNPSLAQGKDPECEQNARDSLKRLCETCQSRNGGSFTVFPSGEACSDFLKEAILNHNKDLSCEEQETLQTVLKALGLHDAGVDAIGSLEGEVAASFSPEKLICMVPKFTAVREAIESSAESWTPEHAESLFMFVANPNITEKLIHQACESHGMENVKRTFHLEECQSAQWLDMLLIRLKKYPAPTTL